MGVQVSGIFAEEVWYLKMKIKNLEKGFYVKYVIATLCLISIFIVSIAHAQYMDQKISDISRTYLSKISVQNADILSGQINAKLQTINVMARMIGSQEELNIETIMPILETESKSNEYISMGVVLKDGTQGFTPILIDGRDGSVLLLPADWEYIQKTMEGHVGLDGGASRRVQGEMVSLYVRPIYHDLKISGVFVTFFSDRFFNNLIIPETFEQEGFSYIADKNGTILFHSDKSGVDRFSELTKILSNGWRLNGEEGKSLAANIQSNRSGVLEYSFDDKDVYISYVPIEFHNWYLINIIDANVAEAPSKSFYDEVIPSFIYILIILLTVAIYYIYLRSQNYKRLERRMRIESINDESYRMIMEQTEDIIFEYDTMDKTYFHISNFQKTFGYEPTKNGFLGSLQFDYIHPDDVIRFVETYEKMKKERTLAEAEVRIINSSGEYLWTRVYMLGVFDKDSRLAKVIGKIVNIDEKKKELQQLKIMAVMDSATGVYNKQTTEDMINNYLKGEGRHGKHALLVIDIDDFKGINDDYGHRLGDSVIAALGSEINHIFRTSDIKGRIGGDEFMILIKDVDGMDLIVEKARNICRIFKDTEIEKGLKINVSTSIGIALFDQDGSTYEELYEAADKALYNCKNYQKGTFSFARN